jgi:hypothetical protein
MPVMTSGRTLDAAVINVLERQFGLATRAQLRAAGMTPAHLRWWLNRGWQVVLPGVMAAFTGRLDSRQRLTAAMLFGGPDAMITSSSAARWRGAENAPEDGRVHLCVPAHRSVSAPAQLVIRRTTRPDADAWRRGPLTIASPGRSFADAARDATGVRAASAVVIEAVQRRLVTLDALRRELEHGPRCGSTQLRAAVDAATTGAWSLPEHEVLHLLRQSGLFPVVWGNPILTAADGTALPPPDAWLDDIALGSRSTPVDITSPSRTGKERSCVTEYSPSTESRSSPSPHDGSATTLAASWTGSGGSTPRGWTCPAQTSSPGPKRSRCRSRCAKTPRKGLITATSHAS